MNIMSDTRRPEGSVEPDIESDKKLIIDLSNLDESIQYGHVLQKSINKNEINKVKILLETYQYINIPQYYLSIPCEKGYLKIVMLLVKYGADKNALGGELLQKATEYGRFDIVKFLVEDGAKIIPILFILAIRNGHNKILQYLLDLKDEKMDCFWQLEMFKSTCESGRLDTVKLLLSNNIQIENIEPLSLACREGHLQVVKYILPLTIILPRVIQGDPNIDKPLSLASDNDHLDVVKFLIENGVVPSGKCILETPCYCGYYDVVKYLIKHGADVVSYENEPLINACRNGNIDIVQLLLEHGADVYAQEGKALFKASKYGYSNVVKLLIEYMKRATLTTVEQKLSICISINKATHCAFDHKHTDIVDFLFKIFDEFFSKGV